MNVDPPETNFFFITHNLYFHLVIESLHRLLIVNASMSVDCPGSTLLIGGLYTYDLFACSPCCAEHLRCKSCGLQPLTRQENEKDGGERGEEEPNPLQPLPYFSQYSQLLCCQHCRAVDYHFIKPFDEMYDVRVLS